VTLLEEHTVRSADGVRLAVHRRVRGGDRTGPPVLLVPGTFSQRSLWLGTRGEGMAQHLVAAGFDAWTAELRGHGSSERPANWTMHDWIRLDAPALIEYVVRESGADRCFWVGHSSGGVVGAGVLGHRPALAALVRGMVLLAAPGPAGIRGLRRIGAGAAYLAAAAFPGVLVSGRRVRLGPEQEPTVLIREWMGWNLRGVWRTLEGGDYLSALAGVDVPLLAVGGAGDRLFAPPSAVHDLAARFASEDSTVVIAGSRTGFRAEYGHTELVASREARAEIWPLVVDWLRARVEPESPREEES
jgi:pimeloyl-ACP methyl ester carboxylesterase